MPLEDVQHLAGHAYPRTAQPLRPPPRPDVFLLRNVHRQHPGWQIQPPPQRTRHAPDAGPAGSPLYSQDYGPVQRPTSLPFL